MKESFATKYSHHICGGLFQICNTCNRQFCTQCENNLCTAYQTKGLQECCRKAIVEYCQGAEVEPRIKSKMVIKEITDGKL